MGDAGAIVHHDGVRWTAMASGTDQPLYDIAGYSVLDLFAVGEYGVILHYNGLSWTPMTTAEV